MSARVRAPVRPGLLRGVGRGVRGEACPGDTGPVRIRDTWILSGGTFWLAAGDGVAGLEMEEAGGDTDEDTDDTEDTEDIRGLFSGVSSLSVSLVDLRFGGSEPGASTSFSGSAGFSVDTGCSTFIPGLVLGGGLSFTGDCKGSVFLGVSSKLSFLGILSAILSSACVLTSSLLVFVGVVTDCKALFNFNRSSACCERLVLIGSRTRLGSF